MPRRNSGPKLVWLKKRNCYYITWTESGRSRQYSTGTQDSGEAQTVFADFMHRRQRDSGPRDTGQVLVTDVLTDYAEERAPQTKATDRILFALRPLIDYWGGKAVPDVSRQSCEEYFRWRNRSAGTVRRELGVLRAAINHAFAERRITYPVVVHLPQKTESKDRWLTKHEAALLLRASLRLNRARLHLPLFIVIALHTGQRKEAVLSLRWSQIDLDAGLIQWNPEGREQTKKRRPRARIPTKLLPHLRRARLRGSDIGYVIHRDGKRLGDIKKSFALACKNASLENVTPHTLRHTRATWGMQAGAMSWQLAGFLGMTDATLNRVYGHHHPEYQMEAAENY
jgi:integrase